jgi:predicted RNA-binding Zn-ribbon protein involved in translation (DUF1610 family)
MGDALMEMGKIDQASICYKKAMASTFGVPEDLDEGEDDTPETREKDWQGYLMSFLENKKEVPKKKTKTPPPPPKRPPSKKVKRKVRKQKVARPKPSENEEISTRQTQEETVHFPCPSCGTDVELNSGICSKCQTIFKEEKFENFEPMDDDLVFFERLKALLGKQERFFIHFNGEDGSIRFLDKREVSRTKKPSYVFISANVEQLCYDYTSQAKKNTELDDILADLE